MSPRAAHFLLHRVQANSPLTDMLVAAFAALGFEVDLFAPPGEPPPDWPAGGARILPAEYGWRWIGNNAASPRWRRYAAISTAAEDPAAAAGVISRIHRRPLVMLADEIKSESYAGNRSRRWKTLCRWAMRRARLTIVNDEARVDLQRRYAGLGTSSRVVVYPGCFRTSPRPGHRSALRHDRGIPENAWVLGYSGVLNEWQGPDWLFAALDAHPDLHVLVQAGDIDPLLRLLLSRTRFCERVHVEARRLSYPESWSSMPAIDAGMAVYRQDGPQFQNMGISSTRLCMFLSTGIPVIASRQPSFGFLEQYDCGILVDDETEFVNAVATIRDRLPAMAQNARRCAAEYIDTPARFAAVVDALRTALRLRG